MKRTPLKRKTPLASKTELRRGRGLKRGGPLPRESAKRKAERPLRQAVRDEALRRAGHRCEAADVWPEIECGGPLDVHEVKARGTTPGSHLRVELTRVVCRFHHDAIGAQPTEARARGLRLESWEPDPE